MGASGNLLTAAEQYGRIMIAGGVIQVLSCGLAPILRNENRQVGAMTIMVLGFLFNLTMDFVLLYFSIWESEAPLWPLWARSC